MDNPDHKISQFSLQLSRAPDARIYIHLTIKTKTILLFVTSAQDEQAGPAAMGSFVYALPDRFNPKQPISTTLCAHEPTLEFAARLAKVLARRTNMPVHVGNSVTFISFAEGGTVEEEMEVFNQVVGAVTERLQRAGSPASN